MAAHGTRLSVLGAQGRMGQEVRRLALQNKAFFLLPDLDLKNCTSQNIRVDEKPQVVIDFSSPTGTVLLAKWCADEKIPFVTGTTGLTEEENELVKGASLIVPVFSSPNMSIGLNAMAEAVARFAQIFPGGEAIIEDIHHRDKKDAPSGTAKLLHKTIKENMPSSTTLQDPVSIRGGTVFGLHKAYFFMEGECITFEHQALNRSIFAQGSLTAAQWLTRQKPGLYGMKDLLKENFP